MAFFSRNKKQLYGKGRKSNDDKCEQNPGSKKWWIPLRMSGRSSFSGHSYFTAYRRISAVRMVIDKRAECLASAVPYILDRDGNEPQTGKADALRKLFKNPNFIQSFPELYVLKEIYKLIYGWSVIYLARAFNGAVPYAMYAIPPWMLNFEMNGNYTLYDQLNANNIVKKITLSGTKTPIKFEDLIFFRDSIPSVENPLISYSRMESIFNEYDLAEAISEAEKTVVERRGAVGILSKDINDPNGIGVFEDEREEIQKKYKDTYGLRMSKDQIIITSMALKWQQMMLSTRDLMLIELNDEAQKKIAGVYDVPYNLLPGGSDSTFSNQNEAKKSLYMETALPTSNSDAEKFTAALLDGHGLHLSLDYSGLYLFQDDASKKASAMSTAIGALNAAAAAGYISREEWRQHASQYYLDIDPKN